MRPYYAQNARQAWEQSGFPLTIAIIAINFITMVLVTFRVPIAEFLMFVAPDSLAIPWTLVTYPLLSTHIFSVLFNGLWLFWMGSALERSWGTRFYGVYFAVMAVISALGIALGTAVLNVPGLAHNWLPIAALTLTFCLLNPHEQINLWGILPISTRWLAIGEVIIVFFLYAQSHANPLMGFFALAGCGAAYLWVRLRDRGALPWFSPLRFARAPRQPRRSRPRQPPDDRFSLRDLNPLERLARWRRRRQFERLFEDDKK